MPTLDDEEIRARAYQLWEREGKPDGQEFQHWFQAVHELSSEREQENGGVPVSSDVSGISSSLHPGGVAPVGGRPMVGSIGTGGAPTGGASTGSARRGDTR